MPHVIVKIWPGKTEEQKKEIANKITTAVIQSAGVPENFVSVAIEEIKQEKWKDEVFVPDIVNKDSIVYKKAGYTP